VSTLGQLGEFGFIERLRDIVPDLQTDDDAAFVSFQGTTYALSTDALVEGVHFRRDWSKPEDIGWKAVSVNVSDLCASGGGSPSWLLVAVGAPPDTTSAFLEGVYRGIAEACSAYNAFVVGGDTVASKELFLSISAIGPVLRAVSRSGAEIGDVLAVTGPLGRAACGVNLLLSQDPKKVSPEDAIACMDAHRRPVARIEAGGRYPLAAHAAIDISDGLASDARRLADACGHGVAIETLPIAAEVERIANARGWDAEQIALAGGEDYEVLFAMPDDKVGDDLIRIGRIVDEPGVWYKGEPMRATGFDHFAKP
jgi:thiamine-monophosphate kinase